MGDRLKLARAAARRSRMPDGCTCNPRAKAAERCSSTRLLCAGAREANRKKIVEWIAKQERLAAQRDPS